MALNQATPDDEAPAREHLEAFSERDLRNLIFNYDEQTATLNGRLDELDGQIETALAEIKRVQSELVSGDGDVDCLVALRARHLTLTEVRREISATRDHLVVARREALSVIERDETLAAMVAAATEASDARAAYLREFASGLRMAERMSQHVRTESTRWRLACERFLKLGLKIGLPRPEESMRTVTTKNGKGHITARVERKPEVRQVIDELRSRLDDPSLLDAAQEGHRLDAGARIGRGNRNLWGSVPSTRLPEHPAAEAFLRLVLDLGEARSNDS